MGMSVAVADMCHKGPDTVFADLFTTGGILEKAESISDILYWTTCTGNNPLMVGERGGGGGVNSGQDGSHNLAGGTRAHADTDEHACAPRDAADDLRPRRVTPPANSHRRTFPASCNSCQLTRTGSPAHHTPIHIPANSHTHTHPHRLTRTHTPTHSNSRTAHTHSGRP